MDIFSLQSNVLFIGFLIVLCLKGFAFVTAMTFPAPAYEASSKFTKVGWGIILGLGLAAQLIIWNPIGIVNILFLVAACVFLVDVRPALRQITGR
ncbi:DUF2516 family protein [Nocardioides daphniae]|uniref:Membrane protein n=1 Tax=Nocardioides daphniae TaxID=402297 RepID=A0ABQ1PYV6_9ACTN|nr:DUF2516 family protein [Nocardioides daphniae]GGD07040.1 membrane protein [Nocardioides daphniae]